MSTPSNAVPEASFESRAVAPAVMAATRPFYWSVRRELWEYRSIYIAPLAVAGVFLLGFFLSSLRLPHRMALASGADTVHEVLMRPFHFAEGFLMVTAMIVGFFYCLDALYGERRDRSILFWKSLPVSDVTAVLAKASIPVALQLIAFVITVALQVIMLVWSSMVLAGSDVSVWRQVSLAQMWFGLLYHLVTVHVLYHAPFYAWLLLVSAWARRAPFLWAIVPPLAIGIFEKVAFNTSYFGHMMLHQLAGGPEAMAPMPGMFPTEPGVHLTPGHFLGSAHLWIGLAVAAAFLACAVRLRHYREPI
jgi:ABC-2 type transport system permease protein